MITPNFKNFGVIILYENTINIDLCGIGNQAGCHSGIELNNKT